MLMLASNYIKYNKHKSNDIKFNNKKATDRNIRSQILPSGY